MSFSQLVLILKLPFMAQQTLSKTMIYARVGLLAHQGTGRDSETYRMCRPRAQPHHNHSGDLLHSRIATYYHQ